MRQADLADEKRRRLVQAHWGAVLSSLQQESKAWLRALLAEDPTGRDKEDSSFSWKLDSHEFASRIHMRLVRCVCVCLGPHC